MLSFFSPKKDVFGLDIGFESLKLVELEKMGSKVLLRGAISAPLTERIIEKDHFKDKGAAAKMIREACDKAKPSSIKARGIVSALPETFVFSKTIQVPKMPEKDYAGSLGGEVSQYLPLPLDEVYIDYQTLIVHPDEPLTDVLFVATPKRLVDEYVEVASLAGYELIALETKPLAVGRALISRKSTDGLMIVEVGTEVSRISIWNGYKIRLTTTVGIGKNQIVSVLVQGQQGDSARPDLEFNPYQKEALSPLIEEISEAIKYHQNRDYQPKAITKILVCGSGAKVPGFFDYLKSEVKVNTEIARPALASQETLDIDFTTAYGLASWNE